MGNIPGQIISELGEIGKKVGGEAAKVPKDIAGKALESLGASSGGTGGGKAAPSSSPGSEKTVWEKIDSQQDQKARRAMARRALVELSNRQTKQKEPSIWERLQMEADQKKEETQKQTAAAISSSLPTPVAKRPRGDLYGIKAKKTAAENRNVRQD